VLWDKHLLPVRKGDRVTSEFVRPRFPATVEEWFHSERTEDRPAGESIVTEVYDADPTDGLLWMATRDTYTLPPIKGESYEVPGDVVTDYDFNWGAPGSRWLFEAHASTVLSGGTPRFEFEGARMREALVKAFVYAVERVGVKGKAGLSLSSLSATVGGKARLPESARRNGRGSVRQSARPYGSASRQS
jgi:hypothetical protein